MRVFRDKASLSANPALWASIQKALEESEYFLLLASPQAAHHRGSARDRVVAKNGHRATAHLSRTARLPGIPEWAIRLDANDRGAGGAARRFN